MFQQPSHQPGEFSVRQVLEEVKDFAHREPVTTVAVACGVGILISLLPNKWIGGAITAVGAMLVRPALVSLGMTKAMELYCQKAPASATVSREPESLLIP